MEDATNATTPGGGEDQGYLTIALIVGVPCGFIILVLLCLILIMCFLVLRSAGEDNSEQVEAMYIRKRFRGLSLEEQRRMKQKGKKNFLQRRSSRSSAADSTLKRGSGAQPGFQGSSSRIAERARPPGNPFGLQEWQLRMVGIEAGDPETEETDLDGEDGFLNRRRPVGAINPLLVAQDEEPHPGYDIPRRYRHTSNRQDDEESDDSMDPYDD